MNSSHFPNGPLWVKARAWHGQYMWTQLLISRQEGAWLPGLSSCQHDPRALHLELENSEARGDALWAWICPPTRLNLMQKGALLTANIYRAVPMCFKWFVNSNLKNNPNVLLLLPPLPILQMRDRDIKSFLYIYFHILYSISIYYQWMIWTN